MSGKHRTKRIRSFWEPIYNPTDENPFPEGKIHDNHTGCKHSTLNESSFQNVKRLAGQKFETCDFIGLFSGKVFDECEFKLCDFGLSTWKFTKFARCTFKKTSFTQTTFYDCEFRDCQWEDMGLSGNETKFASTIVSNPKSLIDSAYTNLDPETLRRVGAHKPFQRFRLQRTKANVARHLLDTLSTRGEEKWFYEAIKVCNISYFYAAQLECKWLRATSKNYKDKSYWTAKLVGYFIERHLIRIIGLFNKWGESLVRPFLFGVAIFVSFSIAYRYIGISKSWPDAWLASADITMVVGYTKHANTNLDLQTQLLYLLNMLFGVFWFAIVVPTLINRISRVR